MRTSFESCVVASSEPWTSMSGGIAETWTVSVTLPSVKLKSTLRVCWVLKRTSSCRADEKPSIDATTE